MVKLKQEYLSFFQLAEYFDCSHQYLHDLVSTGKIIPAVMLSDGERYPGGQFREVYDLGEGIQFGAHTDFDEIYGQDNHGENWPQCARVVYCHFPSRGTPDDYSFGVFSENASPSATEFFYYPRADKLICNKSDGEKRLIFFQPEIDRFLAARDNAGKSPAALEFAVNVVDDLDLGRVTKEIQGSAACEDFDVAGMGWKTTDEGVSKTALAARPGNDG